MNLLKSNGTPNTNLAKDPNVMMMLSAKVSSCRSFSEMVYCVIHDLQEPPKCNCGEYVTFKSYVKGYSPFCSSKCANIYNAVKQSNTKRSWSKGKLCDVTLKRAATNVVKYGTTNPLQSDAIKEKIQQSLREKYGVEYTSQIPSKIQNTIETNMRKYGVSNVAQRHIPPDVLAKLDNKEWLNDEYNHQSIQAIAWKLGVDKTVIQDRLHRFNIPIRYPKDTKPEVIIIDHLTKLGISFIKKDRTVLNGLELDIYIPQLNLAIEYNGLYYHSFNHIPTPKEKNKHNHKYSECASKGIQLIQLTGENWPAILSFLSAKVNSIPNIYARRCVVREISAVQFNDILTKHHLQGARSCIVKLGVFYNDELVGAMGFVRNRKYGWELARLVFANYRVVGGASKLLWHFIKHYNPATIVSYSANAYSVGNVYQKLGFTLHSEQKHDLWYVKSGKLINRQNLQKHKLINILDTFDPELTEQQNLLNNGYRIYYGPGTKTWILSTET